MGRVKHRLYGEIQQRFEAAGIVIPLPTRELRVHAMNPDAGDHAVPRPHVLRIDQGESAPPQPRFAARVVLPVPAEECHRGVDE